MAERTPRLAVLGLGTMGQGMAGSALRSGIPTVVWNRNPEAAQPLSELGAEIVATPMAAVESADVVITMVTDAAAVEAIAVDLGMLEALATGAVWAQMSTIGVEATDTLAGLVAARRPDVSFLDAPVSGSKVPAEQGKLTIFASGPERARPVVEPVFAAIGQRTVWLGPVGTGSRMKLVNNTLLAFSAEAIANSVALANRLGLDAHLVLDAFDGSTLISPWEAAKLQHVENADYSPEFPLRLALKDVHLALEQTQPGQFTALSALAQEWQQVVDSDLGDEDVTVVTRALED